jgi:hypothetical protein
MDLQDAYRSGYDPYFVLKKIRSILVVDTADPNNPNDPQVVADRVDALQQQLSILQGIWARSPQTEQGRIQYETEIEQHHRAIERLETIAIQHLTEKLLAGEMTGLGYIQKSSKPPELIIIPPSEWAFLQFDHKAGWASDDFRAYRAIRLIFKSPSELSINPPPTSQEASDTEKPNKKRRRRYWTAIETAFITLSNRLNRDPQAKELQRYLAREDETGIIYPDNDGSLWWKDTKGKDQELTLKIIQNTLTKIKKSPLSKKNPS